MVHHKAYLPAHASRDHDRVDEAHVIADDDAGSLFRNAFESLLVDTVEGVNQQPCQETHQEFGHQQIDVERHRCVHQADHQEQLRDGKPCLEQPESDAGGSHHEDRVENVVGGDDARTIGGLRSLLDERVERHDVEAAKHPEQHQVGGHAPVTRLSEKGAGAGHFVGGETTARKIEIDCEQRQSDRSERHQPDFHLVSR